MKIVFLETGKTKDKTIQNLAETYYKRLKHYVGFELVSIPDLKNTKSMNREEVKRKEAELILKRIEGSDLLILALAGLMVLINRYTIGVMPKFPSPK